MPKRIKHVSELPNWFQIDKYKHSINLDAAGWYEQLIIRIDALEIIDMLQTKEITSDLDKQFIQETTDFGKVLEVLRENPIASVESNKLLSDYFYFGKLREIKPRKLYFTLGVRPITICELFSLEQSVDTETLNILRMCHTSSYYYSHPMNERLNDPLNSIVDKFGSKVDKVAYINWDLPDELLVDHFKRYLKNFRPRINKNQKKRYRKIDYSNWSTFGILPFLDLKIWEIETESNIPYRVMADALYSNAEHGEETIRKTVVPLIDTFNEKDTLELLAFQASLEIEKQKE